MAHHRLFVALRPPIEVRRHLTALMGGVPGARWQDDEQLHCTLRFIGEVDRHQAEDIAAALGHVRHPPLALTLGELGVFDRGGRIDTLWAAVGPRADLKALHERIERALAGIGLASEGRAYVPHITLARFARGAAPLPDLLRALPQPQPLGFAATDFRLYESQLGSDGAVYEAVARYPLG